MDQAKHDYVVIGSGPGGYVSAIRAAQLGFDVACIEMEDKLGGTCLRIGCIPSKAMLESSELYYMASHHIGDHGVKLKSVELDLPTMLRRKDEIVEKQSSGVNFLFNKNKITRYSGKGKITGVGKVVVEGKDNIEITAQHIIIATGSVPATIPGVVLDYDRVGTSTEALSYTEVPKHLVVIGAGYIGLEMGSVWKRLGSKVTVLEYLDRILPGMDSQIAREAQRILGKQGLEFRLSSKVVSAKAKGKKCTVEIEGQESIECDRVLVSTGRWAYTEGLGLENVGVALDERGRVKVDEHWRTNVEGIYAIGDVTAGPMLAHKASEEGVAVAEFIKTGYGHVNYNAIPGVVYTHPEVATVGKSEEELKEAGIEYKTGTYMYKPNGRAQAMGESDGRVKVLADAKTDRVLGIHIIGARASELIAEATVAMEFGASSEDIARTCHAHPTLAEVLKEAALAVEGLSIHQ
jgi:dihydrolipoamide dehydrogenase